VSEEAEMVRNVVVFMVLLFASLSTAITLTPVWEITRPEEWAEIEKIAIHYDGSSHPLVICKTDSSVFTVDHTGTVHTIWMFTQNDTQTERFHCSSLGRYIAISTTWAEGDSGRTGVRVMDAAGTLIWEVVNTPYSYISLADSGPWSVSSIPQIGRESTWDNNLLIRDPSGAIIHERIYEGHGGVDISDDGSRTFILGADSIRCFDNQGSHLWTVKDPPSELECYWSVGSAATTSGAIFVEHYNIGLASSGKVFFRDSLGVASQSVTVTGGYGSLDISENGEYVVLGAYGTFYLIRRSPPSVAWSVVDPGGNEARLYCSANISGDGNFVVGAVSRGDSLISRLEIFNTAGAELFEEQYPTIGRIAVEMTDDGVYLIVMKEQLTSLGRDQMLTLYEIGS